MDDGLSICPSFLPSSHLRSTAVVFPALALSGAAVGACETPDSLIKAQ